MLPLVSSSPYLFSWTFLSILVEFNSAEVWIVSILRLVSCSSIIFRKFLGTIPSESTKWITGLVWFALVKYGFFILGHINFRGLFNAKSIFVEDSDTI